jgi:hypothetical protein
MDSFLQSDEPSVIRQLEIAARTVYFMPLTELSDWPARIELSSRHFGVLLICDGRSIPNSTVFEVARRMVDQGLAYLCAWGPDSERIHDLFDEEIVGDASEPIGDDSVVMTTWHDESMKEAVWYALYLSAGAGKYEQTCRSWVIVPIANQAWAAEALRLAQSL